MMHKTGQISGQPVMVSTGRLYGHLFENPGAGLARNIYWNFSFEFDPIEIDDRPWTPSAAVEWVEFPSGVKALGGSWLGDHESCPGAEASFYVFEHTWAEAWKIALVPKGDQYDAELEMTVDYPGFDGDPVPGLRLTGRCPVTFDGIILVKESLPEKPETPEAARMLAVPFLPGVALDVIDEDWRFVLRPSKDVGDVG